MKKTTQKWDDCDYRILYLCNLTATLAFHVQGDYLFYFFLVVHIICFLKLLRGVNMKKVQDTHLNIGGLNWPVLINVEQVCRVMVDLRKNIELGLRCVLDCIKAINRRIKVRKRVSCCFRITERSERKNAKCWNKRSSGWC